MLFGAGGGLRWRLAGEWASRGELVFWGNSPEPGWSRGELKNLKVLSVPGRGQGTGEVVGGSVGSTLGAGRGG